MDAGELLIKGWPYLVAGAPGVWAVWRSWATSRREDRKDRVDLVKLAQDVAADAIKSLQERVEALEEELTELRKEHADTISAKDAELALLRGELRQWKALAQSYEQKLTQAGIDHQLPRQPFWGIEAGSEPTELVEGRLP